jgi:hypothetical protein
MPIALSKPPIVVGIRHTRSATRTGKERLRFPDKPEALKL